MPAIRLARALPAALLLLGMAGAAEAQNRRTYIEVKPRSWLDAGKVVTPGSMQNYVYDTQGGFGTSFTGSRFSNNWILPDRFGSGRPIEVDFVAPDFLR